MSSANTVHHKVVVCRDLGPNVMPILRDRKDIDLVVWPEDRPCEREWLLESIRGATGVILMLTEKVDAELIAAAGPSLRVVSTVSVGYEHVDLNLISKHGIKLGYTPDVLTDAVADLSVMLALMAARNGGEVITVVKNGQESNHLFAFISIPEPYLNVQWPTMNWSPFAFCGPQLSTTPTSPTRKVGFLGLGRISQATLARLVPFGITHCLYTGNPASPPNSALEAKLLKQHSTLQAVTRVDLDTLAQESDVLFVLAPGGQKTRHLINAAFLRKMKPTAVLVNTSRGTLVDSDALAKALHEGWIWGAGLDVVEGEPQVPADHPLVKEPKCVVLPHIASATLETRLGMTTLAARNVLAGVLGEPLPQELDLQNRG